MLGEESYCKYCFECHTFSRIKMPSPVFVLLLWYVSHKPRWLLLLKWELSLSKRSDLYMHSNMCLHKQFNEIIGTYFTRCQIHTTDRLHFPRQVNNQDMFSKKLLMKSEI